MAIENERLDHKTPLPLAARVLVEQSLGSLEPLLTLAATCSESDIEHVHQLRIATRRAISALEAFREFLPFKRRKKVTKQLKKIRRFASKARDLDVLILRHSKSRTKNLRFLRSLKSHRKRAQKPIIEVFKRVRRRKSFRRNCRKLVLRLKRVQDDDAQKFGSWARQRLAEYVSRFFSHQPTHDSSITELHCFRIATKRFRYSLELLEPALKSKQFALLGKDIKRIQVMLGKINDRAVALQRMQHMNKRDVKLNKRLLEKERDGLNSALKKFRKWWTPEMARDLRIRFDEFTLGRNAS